MPPLGGSDRTGEDGDEPVYLTEMTGLAPALESQAKSINRGLAYDYSRAADEEYLMNHCLHCGAKIGDYFVFKAEGPLLPYYDEAQLQRIDLVATVVPIQLEDAAELGSSFIEEIVRRRVGG